MRRVSLKNSIYRRAAEEEKEPLPEKGEKFQFSGDQTETMARILALGLAVILKQAGIEKKEQMKELDLNSLLSTLPNMIRSVATQKGPIREEFRAIVRYGPKTYLERKIRELRSL